MWPKFNSTLLATAALGVAALNAAAAPPSKPAKSERAPKTATPAPAAPSGKATPGAKPATTPPAPLVQPPATKDYDLTKAQQERMQKLLPKAYPKLASRAAFHVVAIGDEVIGMAAHNEDAGNALKSWAGQFVNELSNQFIYTGGVRLIKPGKQTKSTGPRGPAITLRCLPRDGGLMTQAMQSLTTYGFESTPDLVIVSFGINDAASAQDLSTYARALQQVIETVRSKGADLVLVAPTLTAGNAGGASFGATRAFASTMREAAEASGVLFADPGDLSGLMKFDLKTQEPASLADDALKQYRRFFTWPGAEDYLHPVAELHRLLGGRIFDLAVDGAKPSAWKLAPGAAAFDKAGHFTLTTEIENTGKDTLTLCAAGLETARWKPSGVLPKMELKAGAKQAISLVYDLTTTDANSQIPALPAHEPILRLPLLITTGEVTQVEEVHAAIKPVAVLWKLDSQFNQKDSFTLENVVVNATSEALKGAAWKAEWNGQKKSGALDIAANATGELPLKFDIPRMSSKDAIPVKLEVTANGVTLQWERMIECTPNVGLKQEFHLVPLGKNTGRVKFRADADATNLFLTFDMDSIDLEASRDGTAIQLELSLDARSFGKRLTFGAIEPLTFRCGSADGMGVTSKIAPWAFGTGYGMVFDPAYVLCRTASGSKGSRRLTVTLPRSYLYLHEWALGNGNSQLGFNTRLSFWRNGGFTQDATFSITNNRRPDTDAEGLSVLELTEEPTSRWSIVIW